MLEQGNNDKEFLKDLAPRLFSEEMDKKREVPEGYFDSLEDQVMAKIKVKTEHKPAGKVRSLINFRNLSIAAGLALLLALIPLLKENSGQDASELTTTFDHQFEAISDDAAALYLAEEYDLESIAADMEVEDVSLSEEEEIFDYLLDSEISESIIYESL